MAEASSSKLARFTGALLSRYVKWVFSSSTVTRLPKNQIEQLTELSPVIFAFWHGQFLLTAPASPENLSVKVMVARHNDAEMISEMLKHFNMALLRGAGAGYRRKDRGGARILREAIKALKEGYTISLTADIPPGPARRSGKGIVTLAKLSGRPIVPTAIASSRYWPFKTWNRFMLNLPYSRVSVLIGDPVWVDKNAGAEELEEARRNVEDQLNRLTRQSYEEIGVDPQVVALNQPGLSLWLYQKLSRLSRPGIGFLLNHRLKKGKEDKARYTEKIGLHGTPRPDGDLCWIHAASVGETLAVLPILESLTERYPHWNFLLTTGTRTSAKLAHDRLPSGAIHQFAPIDHPEFVDRFLEYWQPKQALFVESEIWPNTILALKKRKVPIVLLNARMSPKTYRWWKRFPGISRPLFSAFDLILAQNIFDLTKYLKLGARNIENVGNLKIDSPPPPVDESKLIPLQESMRGRTIFLAASTHPGEEEEMVAQHKILAREFPDLLTIIVPRHPERGKEVGHLVSSAGLKFAQRSSGQLPSAKDNVYLADTLGELGLFYKISDIAFIGGSLIPHGGQNPVEPIRLNCPIMTGPNWHNFRAIYSKLIAADACIETDRPSLTDDLRRLLANSEERAALSGKAEAVIEELGGAQEKTLKALEKYFGLPGDYAEAEEIKCAS